MAVRHRTRFVAATVTLLSLTAAAAACRPAGSDAHTAPPASAGTRSSGTTPPGPAAQAGAGVRAGADGPAGPSGAAQAGDPPVPGPWRLVFDDRFGGDALDSARWVTCYDWNVGGCTNGDPSNHELEWYQPGQVSVGNGVLTLTAERRSVRGGTGQTYPWVSGMVSTGRASWDAATHFTYTYGYAEATIRMPSEPGMFPAFWLLPAASRTTPPEVDIVEMIGSDTSAVMDLHWNGPTGPQSHGIRYGPVDYSAGYHTFGLDWEPGGLTWYIDGVPRRVVTDPARIPAVAMEMLITLAVGYPAAPPPGVSSGSMEIAGVRVWQH